MSEIKFCKRCLYPSNHPYGMIFDRAGICMGCRIHEEKDALNWESRWKILEELVERNSARSRKKGFDCIVPVTGGGDSYFIVETVKKKLGMNPLLVSYNHHYNTRTGIRNLANLTTVFDCDLVMSTNGPGSIRDVVKCTLEKYGSIYWHAQAGKLAFPVQVACQYNIPLIIWGVNGWSEQTGMFSHVDEAEMTERCMREHGMMNITWRDLLDHGGGMDERILRQFVYPSDEDIESTGVRGIYLSNYVRWDSKSQHEKMIARYGYETKPQARTFNCYEDVHCMHSAGVHDYIKYLKFGYGKVVDHGTREIRLGRMERSVGLGLVRKYIERVPDDLEVLLDWIGITEGTFYQQVDRHRDTKVWEKTKWGEWKIKERVDMIDHEGVADETEILACRGADFQITKNAEYASEENYVLMGRGYIDKYNYGSVDPSPKGGMTKRTWKEEDIR